MFVPGFLGFLHVSFLIGLSRIHMLFPEFFWYVCNQRFYKVLFIYFMCLGIFACIPPHVDSSHRQQKPMSDPLELDLQMVAKCWR